VEKSTRIEKQRVFEKLVGKVRGYPSVTSQFKGTKDRGQPSTEINKHRRVRCRKKGSRLKLIGKKKSNLNS